LPVYEYQCQDCGKKFEVIATLAEKEAGLSPACPSCGRKRARQVFSRFTLMTGSKSGSDDFDSDMPDAGMGDPAGMDDLDDMEPDELSGSGELDDIG
jgi:putative FmdB family regulatory protein